MPAGRPSTYTAQIAETVCERIADGQSVREISRADDMPAMSTIFKWLSVHKEFAEQYARAKEAQVEYLAEEILDIADDGTNDWMTRRFGDQETEVANNEAIQRSKVRIEARKWLLAKLAPKKYGDRITQEHTGPGGDPLSIVTRVELVAPEHAEQHGED